MPGSTLTGVSQYWLYVGTTQDGNQLYDQDRGTNLSATVSGLPTNGSCQALVEAWVELALRRLHLQSEADAVEKPISR